MEYKLYESRRFNLFVHYLAQSRCLVTIFKMNTWRSNYCFSNSSLSAVTGVFISHTDVLNHGWLFVIPWNVAHQAPLSMEFSRQEHWSGLPFPSPPPILLFSLLTPLPPQVFIYELIIVSHSHGKKKMSIVDTWTMQKLRVATLQPLSPQSTNNFTVWPFVSLVPHLRLQLTNISCSTVVCIYWKKKKKTHM